MRRSTPRARPSKAVAPPVVKLPQRRLSAGMRYSALETHEQERIVDEGLAQGQFNSMIQETLRERWPTLGYERVRKLIARVLARWAEEAKAREPTARDEQTKRLHRQLLRAQIDLATKPHAKHQMVLKYEQEIARLNGRTVPQQVNVDMNVTHSIQGVVMNLSPEQVAKYTARHEERERLARAYEREHGLGHSAAE